MNQSKELPTLSLDLKKQRIRIHRQTLRLLKNPQYIQLLVNPEEKKIAIRACGSDAILLHRVCYRPQCDYELYSKELMARLQGITENMDQSVTYRGVGELSLKEGIAMFPIDTFVPVEQGIGSGWREKERGIG